MQPANLPKISFLVNPFFHDCFMLRPDNTFLRGDLDLEGDMPACKVPGPNNAPEYIPIPNPDQPHFTRLERNTCGF